jgi:hypothetical protein
VLFTHKTDNPASMAAAGIVITQDAAIFAAFFQFTSLLL